jgi:hypothetical protein
MTPWTWHSSAETCWSDKRLYYCVCCTGVLISP